MHFPPWTIKSVAKQSFRRAPLRASIGVNFVIKVGVAQTAHSVIEPIVAVCDGRSRGAPTGAQEVRGRNLL